MTGVSECSQQRGNLKDDGYTLIVRNVTGVYHRYFGGRLHISFLFFDLGNFPSK
ncbi:hypothetical protein ACK3F5_22375 [Photorhabdus asymbiotica UENP]|uniref:hypothetical protein n=1 Tax=Photorhabdus TaxID=29487 RepID=UPI001473362E|nr:hypothetical protein [Photorhabdus asymbiotica]